MTEKLEKCRSRNFAIGFVERWIDLAVQDGESMEQVKNNISTFLTKTFGQWKYVLVVYPPHSGGDNHYTNYDIRRFRFYGHNIVLHFLPQYQNSRVCKGLFVPDKWCPTHKKRLCNKYRCFCPNGNVNADHYYNWIKNNPGYFGHISALTVLQGHSLALAGQDICLKYIKIQRQYKVHKSLTIVYA